MVNALKLHVRNELGPIAVPAEIDFTPTLPKTRSGKIMRRLLKAQELGLDPGGHHDAGGVGGNCDSVEGMIE